MNRVIYFWYDHLVLRNTGEAATVKEAILSHDYETFQKFYKKYGASFFPGEALIIDDDDEVTGYVNILSPETFAQITDTEYECG